MMVNRKMKGMDLPHITSSCCETVSENLVDSVISPLFYFGLFGLPGAIAFRCSNLMDAMWGHINEKYYVLGHFPARLDDVLGYIPSRISPLFVGVAAKLMRMRSGRSAVKAAMAEHRKTPSPNSGWPMTAVAAAMGVSFEKEGVYVMGEGPLPSIDDIRRCYHLVELTSLVFLLIVTIPLGMFLGILFLAATALIIYYKQVSEGYEDRKRFEIMQQVGMSRREVRETINSQVRMVFFLPLAVAALHILMAFSMIRKLLLLFSLTDVGLFALCTVGTLLIFSAIYALVYSFTAKAYYKIVRST